jgi:hypothetical protein
MTTPDWPALATGALVIALTVALVLLVWWMSRH